MLSWLLTPHIAEWSFLNLLTYITVRAGMAALTAFVLGVLCYPAFIRYLRRKKIGEQVEKTHSHTLAELHADKKNTPTMGGLLMVGAIALAAVLWGDVTNPYLWLLVGTLLMAAAIGFQDDWTKLTQRQSHGMSARTKMAGLVGCAVMVGVAMLLIQGELWPLSEGGQVAGAGWAGGVQAAPATVPHQASPATMYLPLFKEWHLYLGLFYLVLVVLVVTGTSNAVNLTDGLDGLAAGCLVGASLVFMVVSYVVGRVDYSAYLGLPYVPGAGEVTVFLGALTGAALAFLWYNCPPAEVFMGDTGSISLGAALGVAALITRQELLLVVVGGIFVLEALSVMVQVTSFKLTGRRVLRCAPIHHHYQFGGLPETKVTIRFWIVSGLLALVALLTLKIR